MALARLPLLALAAVRQTCHRCARPQRTCLCPALPAEPLPLDSRVIVLQHPAESRRSDSTTQLIPLCIDPVNVVRDVKLEPALLRHYASGRRPLLLFPGEGARPLTERDAADNNCLVVIDGTWRQARHMLCHSPELAALERVALGESTTSRLEPLRREPAGHCTSTAEACAAALRRIERTERGEAAAAALERATGAMVEHALRHAPPVPPRAPSRKRSALVSHLQVDAAPVEATAVLLDAVQHPLANAFYRRQQYRATTQRQDRVHVLRSAGTDEIIGAVRLTPRRCESVGDLFFVRSLCVASEWRRRGLATRLLRAALAESAGRASYAFPFAELAPLYRAAGFRELPAAEAPAWLEATRAKVAGQQRGRVVLMVRDVGRFITT